MKKKGYLYKWAQTLVNVNVELCARTTASQEMPWTILPTIKLVRGVSLGEDGLAVFG
jgi:hypothetical protein